MFKDQFSKRERTGSSQHLATLVLAEEGAYIASASDVSFSQFSSRYPPGCTDQHAQYHQAGLEQPASAGTGVLPGVACFFKPPRTSIPYRQPRPVEICGLSFAPRTPRTRALCQLLALATLVMVLVQALSCGLFFCVALPIGRTSYIDLREVFTEFRLFNAPQSQHPADSLAEPARVPMLVPRIIHQTYRSRQLPDTLRVVRDSWGRMNGDHWQLRFYDDADCIAFVEREFPEYLDAYRALPKDVERSDFFRYMVVLRLGGVYADIDVELRQPLDSLIGPTDTLVTGWEAEVATDAEAFKRHFVRKRQVLQWFFAAAPGHPVLRAMCDHIARNTQHTFSNNTNRDTLERTGPGAWTDMVLRHAAAHPAAAQPNDPWKVRILPRVALGVHPAGIDGLTPDAPEIVALHHFLGSWKKKGGWHKRRTVLQLLAAAASAALARGRGEGRGGVAEEPIPGSPDALFPVEAAFNPPFHIMTNLIGHGDRQSGSDVSATITSWGVWQAAFTRPSRKPLVVDALVGSLSNGSSSGATPSARVGEAPCGNGLVLVDVSAGLGFFSLAAAARGHQVVAFETSTPSIRAFGASILYNKFQDKVQLYNVSLGAAPGTLCLKPAHAPAGASTGTAAALSAGAAPGSNGSAGSAGAAAAAVAPAVNAFSDAATATRRGYGDPMLHNLPAAQCDVMTVRQTLTHMLTGGDNARSGLASRVGALRLSAHGWEGWILDGARDWMLSHPPGVVLLEFAPQLVERSGYPGGGVRILEQLYAMGYVHMAHAGYVCDERWFNISRALRSGGSTLGDVATAGGSPGATAGDAFGSGAGAAAEVPRQPTWCKLKPEIFQLLVDRAHPEVSENVLFIHRTHHSVRAAMPSSDQQQVAVGAASGGAAAAAAASEAQGQAKQQELKTMPASEAALDLASLDDRQAGRAAASTAGRLSASESAAALATGARVAAAVVAQDAVPLSGSRRSGQHGAQGRGE